jgi:hypothetical protein
MRRLSFEPIRGLGTTIRSLARRPAFTGLSVFLTALSVGAVTAIVAVVNATLLRPLPYRDPAMLYSVSGTEPVTARQMAR